jgi:predicted RecA/RadA family phage recombinase
MIIPGLTSTGATTMLDHVATAPPAVAASGVSVVGGHVRIKDPASGNLAIGGGCWTLPKATGGGSAIADGTKVYWDATNGVVTATVGANKMIGYIMGTNHDADTSCVVYHHCG